MAIETVVARVWENLILRISGPMKFRLVLQPAMAIYFGIRNGLQDAKEQKPAYFWALFTDPGERSAMLQSGWKSVGKVFLLAIVIDVIYQLIEQRWIYPGEAVLVAILLAIVPYLLVRGPVNRIARRSHKSVKERIVGD
ncbi:MAG: hypothetical protein WB608_25860 [Terracidiphilus sp.]